MKLEQELNEKLPYNKPVLTLFGEVADLTESGRSPGFELGGENEPENPETIGPNYYP